MDFAHQKHQELNHKAYHKAMKFGPGMCFFLPFYLQEWAETNLKCRSYRFRKSLKRVGQTVEGEQPAEMWQPPGKASHMERVVTYFSRGE
jgi:hypothetical protein